MGHDSVVAIIDGETESWLRREMFEIYKQFGIKATSDYESRLAELVKKECLTQDVRMSEGIGKRYLYRRNGAKKDATADQNNKNKSKKATKGESVVPLNTEQINMIKQRAKVQAKMGKEPVQPIKPQQAGTSSSASANNKKQAASHI